MNSIETRILDYGKNIDMNLQNISEQIEEIKIQFNSFLVDKEYISKWSEEDEEDDFDDGIWIEFPFSESE